MTVAVVTDSAASLPVEVAARHGLTVVPLVLAIDGTSYDDGDLSLGEVMARAGDEVTTSGPSPGRVAAILEGVLAGAEEALVLTIAHSMSSTFDAARMAAQGFGERVRVIDTETAAGAEGLVVLAAAARAAAGGTLDEVGAAAQRAIHRVRLVATVPTLDRLVHSGRVPGIAGWAGTKLGVHPLFEFRGGDVKALRPALSRAAALARIEAAWRESRAGGPHVRLHVAALHAGAADDAARLLTAVRDVAEPATAFVGEFSPVMVTHTGAGLVGLAWWWEPLP